MSQAAHEPLSVARSYWVHNVTPLHVGTGRGLGFIDLPISREKVTNFPVVPGSSFKGVLTDFFDPNGDMRVDDSSTNAEKRLFQQAFGKGGDDASNAGSLVFTDARIICFPVRSLYGTFAWCTCPIVLDRLSRDLESIARKPLNIKLPGIKQSVEIALPACVPNGGVSVLRGNQSSVFLDDLDLEAEEDQATSSWAEFISAQVFGDPIWQKLFKQRFLVVDNDVFSFLTELSTQIDARVRIDQDSKTVAGGALWYEESLPAESILSGIAWCGPVFRDNAQSDSKSNRFDRNRRQEIMDRYTRDEQILQLGGKASVGRGQVRVRFV